MLKKINPNNDFIIEIDKIIERLKIWRLYNPVRMRQQKNFDIFRTENPSSKPSIAKRELGDLIKALEKLSPETISYINKHSICDSDPMAFTNLRDIMRAASHTLNP